MGSERNFQKLFEPGKIGKLELPNRIVMSGMGTNFATAVGEATEDYIDWFLPRARAGVGLIFIGAAFMATAMDPTRNLALGLRIDHDSFTVALTKIAEAVHEAGARVGIQLSPGLSSQARGAPWSLERQHIAELQTVGPSPVTHPLTQRRARELTIEEIEKIIELCGWAAKRARDAGFDIIEIPSHGAFLVGQFLSPYFNRRADRYGGTPARRMRFLLEVIESMRKRVGPDFPITVKYSITDGIEGGRTVKEGQGIARGLEKAGINGISVASGIHGSKQPGIPTVYQPEGTFVYLAEALKQVVSLPLILSGRLGDPALAEKVLEEGMADFIAWGRPLVADPDLPRKVADGRLDEVRKCIYCNECLHIQWDGMSPMRCTVNPVAGREGRYGRLHRADTPRKVVVVGAGPAGLEAARVAALRGHKVVLYDKNRRLVGGQLKLASMPPHKEILRTVVEYYQNAFKTLNDLKVVLGTEVTARDVIKQRPDAVVVATGAEPYVPDAPAAKSINVISAQALLSGQATAGKTVVVSGGGFKGCEVASWLVGRGKKVTVVEALDAAATDVHAFVRVGLLSELSEQGVKILTGVKIDSLAKGVGLVDKKGRKTVIKADTLVLAPGVRSANRLADELKGKVREVYTIGDARKPRSIRNAISEGYVTAFDL